MVTYAAYNIIDLLIFTDDNTNLCMLCMFIKICCLHFHRGPGPSLLKTIFHIQGEPLLQIVSSQSTWTIEFPIKSGVVAYTYNSNTGSRDRVGSKPVTDNNPAMGGWIVWPPVLQHKERNLTRLWDLAETY